MSILVTGGAGYIGSVVVDDLMRSGEQVVVLDNLSRGHRGAVSSEARFYAGNIGDKDLVRQICSENDITEAMHFSAFAYVGESVSKPDIYYQNNTLQTAAFVDTLLECCVNKLVFSSTCATYGEPQYVPIDEKHSQHPTNPYGWSKFFVERILQDYDAAFGLKFVALRYFNACGATDTRGENHDPETHLIPLILDAAAGKRESISVFGDDYPTPDGTAIRDYIHVSDISGAHLAAMKHLSDGGASEFINLGNGQGYSVLEVVEAARRVTGKTIQVEIAPRREGDPSRLIANAAKAREVLGWEPRFPDLDSIISSAWKWYQTHAIRPSTS
jgi:UDP-glucose 4-epimerase